MYFFENRYSPRRRFNPVHSPFLSAAFVSRNTPADRSNHLPCLSSIFARLNPQPLCPSPSVTRTFLLYHPAVFLFHAAFPPSRADRSIERDRRREEARSIPITVPRACTRVYATSLWGGRRRWKERKGTRRRVTRDDKGLSHSSSIRRLTGRPTKGIWGWRWWAPFEPPSPHGGSLNISFRIPRNV